MLGMHSKNSLLPTPKFLLMPAAGIDISDRSIKYVKLVPQAHGFSLDSFCDIPLGPGIVENGQIISQNKLREVLIELREKYKISFVRTALPEKQMYFFRMTIPSGPYQVLHDTIELSLEDHVPIPAAETVFDFDVVGHTGADVEVAVTASLGTVVDSYISTFKSAGLSLLSIELEADALARAVIHREDKFAHLIVDFGETRTGIAVAYGGQIYFTSTVGIGGQILTDTLAKHFNISNDEAEKMKREFGLRRNSPHQDLFSLLLNNIAVLRDEINRHFIYWHTHPDEKGVARPPIEQIVLVGGDSNLAGLSDYLSVSLRVKTVVADIWTNVNFPKHGVPELSRQDSLGYATAIGLSMHDINNDQKYE